MGAEFVVRKRKMKPGILSRHNREDCVILYAPSDAKQYSQYIVIECEQIVYIQLKILGQLIIEKFVLSRMNLYDGENLLFFLNMNKLFM